MTARDLRGISERKFGCDVGLPLLPHAFTSLILSLARDSGHQFLYIKFAKAGIAIYHQTLLTKLPNILSLALSTAYIEL